MPMPRVGDRAPHFSLQDQGGNTVTLADFAGKHVVLYFYPKDDTPGCTREACAFRDDYAALQRAGAVVLGVSPDDVKSHQRFANKFSLPFPLLADTGHQVAEAYGVWGEKSLYGRTFMGIQRATFLIGPDGTLVEVWPKVKVDAHAAEVQQALARAQGAGVEPQVAAAAAPSSGQRRSSTTSPARKAATKKAAGRKAAGRRTGNKQAAKKAPAKKAAGKKTAAKKAPAKKAAAKKAPARKAPAKKAAAKKAPARKAPAKKAAGGRGLVRKTRPVAVRGRMKPGTETPAEGVGAPVVHLAPETAAPGGGGFGGGGAGGEG